MKTKLVRIGNSRGVRIPKPLIEQAGLEEDVEIEVTKGGILIGPVREPRAGWEEAARQMREEGEAGPLGEQRADRPNRAAQVGGALMLYDVVAVKALSDFRVWVRFEDGLEGEVDLSGLVGKGVFARWTEDPAEFSQVRVDPESGTIVWPGGLDVAPDGLYRDVARAAGRNASRTEV